MDVLREYIRSLLTEGKVEKLEAKYPNVDVRGLAEADPSGKGKYLTWMVKQVAQGAKQEDVIPTVSFFHRNANKFQEKDINKYTAKELEDKVKEIASKKSKTQMRKEAKGGVEKIYEDDDVLLMRVDTKDACMIYGANTQWCITMSDETYYEQYKSSNVVFHFIINKTVEDPKYHKIAIATQRDADNQPMSVELFDAEDDEYTPEELEQYAPPKLVEMAVNDAVKQPKAFLARLKSKDEYSNEELVEYWTNLNNIEDLEDRRTAKKAVAQYLPDSKIWSLLTEQDLEDVVEDWDWGQIGWRVEDGSVLMRMRIRDLIDEYGGSVAEWAYRIAQGRDHLEFYDGYYEADYAFESISSDAEDRMREIYAKENDLDPEEAEDIDDDDLKERFSDFLMGVSQVAVEHGAEKKIYQELLDWVNEHSFGGNVRSLDGDVDIEIDEDFIARNFTEDEAPDLYSEDVIRPMESFSYESEWDAEAAYQHSEDYIDDIE